MTKKKNFDFSKRDQIEIIYEIVKMMVEQGPQSYRRLKGYSIVNYLYFKRYIVKCLAAGLIIPKQPKDKRMKHLYDVTEKGRKYYKIMNKDPTIFRLDRNNYLKK